MYEAAERLEHKILQDFIKQRVKLRPKSTNDIINLLKSDLAYDPVLTTATLSEQFLKDLNIGQDGNHRIGELALLAFAKKGGVIRAEETNLQAFIISPCTPRHQTDGQNSAYALKWRGTCHC